MISLRGTTLEPDERVWLASPVVGGVILFARNFLNLEQVADLIADIHAVRSPPLLVAVDQEGGRVQRFRGPFTNLPAPRLLGYLFDENPEAAEEAARSLAWLMASELRAVGVDLSFAPVVDLDLGLAAVIGDRAMHRDPEVVSRLAQSFQAGALAGGMAITAKHFPTHAGATADSHLEIAVDRRPYRELLEDLEPYRQLIEAGLHGVMVGHVIFPELDPLPASLSSWWVKSQLRGELGFHGAVISDDLGMAGAAVSGGLPERVGRALEAGCDLVLLCNVPEEISAVLAALADYVDPASQLRLMRLRGTRRRGWDDLRATPEWAEARRVLAALAAKPKLELEG
jgi:beta-N-acetylhexosaminidase